MIRRTIRKMIAKSRCASRAEVSTRGVKTRGMALPSCSMAQFPRFEAAVDLTGVLGANSKRPGPHIRW